MTTEKKVYTMEDNIRYISFGIKDIVKEFQSLNVNLALLTEELKKVSPSDSLPF